MFKHLKFSEACYEYQFNKGQHKIFASQAFKHWTNPAYKESRSWKQLGPNVMEHKRKTGFSLRQPIWNNHTSELFKSHLYFDPDNHIYLKVQRQMRSNSVDTEHASPEMIQAALCPDQLMSVILGLKYTDFNSQYNGFSAKVQTEVSSDYSNYSFLKFKARFRYHTLVPQLPNNFLLSASAQY